MNRQHQATSLCPTELLPHRPPMLLLDKVVDVDASSATALTTIAADSLFFVPDKGIPGWVGLEFMGQTAALIAGYQQRQGQLAQHTGFLLGSRLYTAHQAWFLPGRCYRIVCQQDTILGESLASFQCRITDPDTTDSGTDESPSPEPELIATATLTVYRQSTAGTDQ